MGRISADGMLRRTPGISVPILKSLPSTICEQQQKQSSSVEAGVESEWESRSVREF